MDAVLQLAPTVGIESACDVRSALLGLPSIGSAVARAAAAASHAGAVVRPTPARALSSEERNPFAPCSIPSASRIARPPPSMPRCSMKASISVRLGPCIACWNKTAQPGNAAINSPIPRIRNRNCWPPRPINCGVGTSPNCAARPSGPTSISTSSSTSSAATSSAGWWLRAKSAELAKQAHRRNLRQAEDPAGPTHPPCRPRLVHALQAGGLAAGRSQRHQDPQPALHFQRQPVFGKPVPDHEVSPRVSRSLRLHPGQPRFLPDASSPGTTTSIAIPASA